MRAVVQRVTGARVTVEGAPAGAIEKGLLLYVGVEKGDTGADADYMAGKVVGLRVFPDREGKMNLSVKAVGGRVLLVSQFTLHGDVRRGRRPSFDRAEAPERARELMGFLAGAIEALGVRVEEGRFRAHMEVASTNDGPVTLLVDSRKVF
ncbi:MAG: D-aminoacyl-tRNA deacylase [Thermodesulfobacteriota bacterium]